MAVVSFELNGKPVSCDVPAEETLIDTIRNRFKLTGTKKGCGTGDCGSCTVLLDGVAVRSCMLLTGMAEGRRVTTIEGVGTMEHLHPVQQAFVDVNAIQCGYCIPGIVMELYALFAKNPDASDEQLRSALAKHYCRCTGYEAIYEGAKLAQRYVREEAAGA